MIDAEEDSLVLGEFEGAWGEVVGWREGMEVDGMMMELLDMTI